MTIDAGKSKATRTIINVRERGKEMIRTANALSVIAAAVTLRQQRMTNLATVYKDSNAEGEYVAPEVSDSLVNGVADDAELNSFMDILRSIQDSMLQIAEAEAVSWQGYTQEGKAKLLGTLQDLEGKLD
eukprot:gene32244-27408_t